MIDVLHNIFNNEPIKLYSTTVHSTVIFSYFYIIAVDNKIEYEY